MNIQKTNNINFGTRVNTFHVIEITTLKIFEKDGFMGMTDTVKKIYNVPKATGHRGYRYYAKLAGDKISEKYPQIREIADSVIQITKQNPDISKEDLHNRVCEMIKKLGSEIDIEI